MQVLAYGKSSTGMLGHGMTRHRREQEFRGREIDAAIFPVVPCANTNFPLLMSAEKIAAAMV